MLDFVLGLYFAGLLVRGWMRGLVKEAMDLAGMLIGLALAFRLSGPAGKVVEATTGVSDPTAPLLGGVAVFLIVGLGATVLSHYLSKVARLPGLNLSNRLLGGALALAWALFLATLILSLVKVLPLPGSAHESIDNSRVASALTDPGFVTHRAFTVISGDDILANLLSLEDVLGERSVILDEDDRIEFDAVPVEDLEDAPDAAREIFEFVNLSRIEAGVDPLAWSDALADVAIGHARAMYANGYFSHVSPVTGTVADRVEAAGIPYRIVGENLALAVTPSQVHEGLMDSPGHYENIVRPTFRRVGIAAIKGPLGFMVVQVFSG
ncbi:MAG: CvpA family protein [Acidimicrobiia bacterium]|nr:CvpA family protein [Acidimicrobiia bacterium]